MSDQIASEPSSPAAASMLAIGLMSGTSQDGVDVALIDTDGERIGQLGATACRPYSNAERTVGWSIDSLEAQAFAYLAVRSLRGLPLSYPTTTGAPRPLTGGVLARP